MRFLFILLFPFISFGKQEAVVVKYKYKNSPSAVTKSITLKELKWVYGLTKQQTPYYPPSPNQFFQDFLRFKLGVEVALYDKSLVSSPKIEKMITNPFLKASFHQELYKALAELKLKTSLRGLEKSAASLSDNQLKNLYRKDSQYNFNYISIYHPINPTSAQKKEASSRAQKIYKQVRASKKSFTELIPLVSDDKYGGLLNWNRTRSSILPQVYKVVQKMKNGSVSKPIKVSDGYIIVKMNQRIPYNKSIHEKPLKENYFAEKKSKALNAYMNRLKKRFTITFVNKNLINSLK
ncbi:MAG: peptidylprolyl isomerase [Bdellovibrionales bacterium]